MEAVAKRPKGGLPAPLTESLAGAMPNAYKLLPADVPQERFRAAVFLHLTQSPKLVECDAMTVLDCCIRAAADGLLPGLECFFLPFKGKASYVRHYQGLLKVLDRTGRVKRAFAHPVYEGDTFAMDYGSDQFSHIPYLVLDREPGKIRFYYGVIITTDGVPHVQPVALDYIETVRKRAPGGEQEAWKYHGVEMARKTALKYACKYVQLTADVQALLADEEAQIPAAPSDAQHAATVRELWGEAPARQADTGTPSPPEGPLPVPAPVVRRPSSAGDRSPTTPSRTKLSVLIDEARAQGATARRGDSAGSAVWQDLEQQAMMAAELVEDLTASETLLAAKAETLRRLLQVLPAAGDPATTSEDPL